MATTYGPKELANRAMREARYARRAVTKPAKAVTKVQDTPHILTEEAWRAALRKDTETRVKQAKGKYRRNIVNAPNIVNADNIVNAPNIVNAKAPAAKPGRPRKAEGARRDMAAYMRERRAKKKG
jgi:hypothetical protein